MCRVIAYSNPHCKCKWLQVYKQCKPNAGFSQCRKKHKLLQEADEHECRACPVHDLMGCYDRNFVRMVIKERSTFRVGFSSGNSRRDPGCDIRCNVM